MLLAMPSSGL